MIAIINIKVTVLSLLNEEEYACFSKDAKVRSFFPHRESRSNAKTTGDVLCFLQLTVSGTGGRVQRCEIWHSHSRSVRTRRQKHFSELKANNIHILRRGTAQFRRCCQRDWTKKKVRWRKRMDLEIVYPKIYSTFESLQSQARSSEEHKRRFIVDCFSSFSYTDCIKPCSSPSERRYKVYIHTRA